MSNIGPHSNSFPLSPESTSIQVVSDDQLDMLFNLNFGGDALSRDEVKNLVDVAYQEMVRRQKRFCGYQANQQLNYCEDLGKFLNMHLNNIGDPNASGGFTVNAKYAERAVIKYISQLWHAPESNPNDMNDPKRTWGYVLSMGCTEGNLYALRNARDYLSGKFLIHEEPLFDDNHQLNPPTSKLYHGVPSIARLSKSGKKSKPTTEASSESSNFSPPSSPQLCSSDEENKHGHSVPYQIAHVPISLDKTAAAYTPVLFYSDQTHYSIDKIKDILCIQTFADLGNRVFPGLCPINDGEWPERVSTHPDGSIDIDVLEKLVTFFAKLGHPIMICFNYGSTFKGAYDNVDAAYQRLIPIFSKYGQARRSFTVQRKKNAYSSQIVVKESIRKGYWFHVDGALGAAYGSLFDATNEQQFKQTAEWVGLDLNDPAQSAMMPRMRSFDFGKPNRVQSISMSGHKEIGAPFPTGVVLTKRKYMLDYHTVSYIASTDSTLSGSRNGLAAMVMWHYFASKSLKEQANTVYNQLLMAKYAAKSLAEAMGGGEPNDEQNGNTVLYHENSLSVIFWKPSDWVVEKFSLSTDSINGRLYAHIFCMPHLKKENIDELCMAIKGDSQWQMDREALRLEKKGHEEIPSAELAKENSMFDEPAKVVEVDDETECESKRQKIMM